MCWSFSPRALLSPGDEVIICPPTFPVYELTAKQAGSAIVTVPLQPGTFAWRVDAILDAVSSMTRLLYLCSPNNPTGSLLPLDQLNHIIDSLPQRVIVVFDEVYYHFISEQNRPDPVDYILQDANILALHSFSKAYGLAGLRLGYGIAKPQIARQISALQRPFHLNTLCFEAGLAALADTSHVEKTVAVTLAGRDWLIGHIRELGLEAWPSQSNFILFRCPVPAIEWAEKLQGYNILVRPAFGLPDHLRVTVGLPEANHAFIDALSELAVVKTQKPSSKFKSFNHSIPRITSRRAGLRPAIPATHVSCLPHRITPVGQVSGLPSPQRTSPA